MSYHVLFYSTKPDVPSPFNLLELPYYCGEDENLEECKMLLDALLSTPEVVRAGIYDDNLQKIIFLKKKKDKT